MKKITLTLIAAVFAVACSDDDSAARSTAQACDCTKHIIEYDSGQQVWNIVSSMPYSNDCSDDTDGAHATDGATTYYIECEPQTGAE